MSVYGRIKDMKRKIKGIERAGKRLIDIIVSLICLILLAIPFILVALAIKINSKGPVFFKAERVGYRRKGFIVYKFRSMVENAASVGLGVETSAEDPRITRVGKFLRNWSIDELPQLINVLRGDMSLVGPRPAMSHQVDKYSPEELGRLEVRPGLTGWAQVNGRNLLSWKERIELDLWYIDNWSLLLDIKILFITPWKIISREGLYGKNGKVTDYE